MREPDPETMERRVAQTQENESRTEKVALSVTKTEKAAVRAIAALRETDESNLCREVPIAEIVAEYRRLQAATPMAAAGAAE